jgi:type II secretory pathway component PulF
MIPREMNTKERIGRFAMIALWGVALALVLAIVYAMVFSGDQRGAFVVAMLFGGSISCAVFFSVYAIFREKTIPKILAYLEQAVRLNLPLPGILSAAAQGETGIVRARLIALRDSLEQGAPLEMALTEAMPEISPRLGNRIAAAQHAGHLDITLRRINKKSLPHDPFQMDAIGIYRIYPWVVLLVMGMAVAMLTVFVFPKFGYIARDNRKWSFPLPWSTRLLIHIASSPLWQFVWLALGIVSTLALGAMVYQLLSRPDRRLMRGARPMDYVIWWIPLVGSCARNGALAELCESIADSVSFGEPLDRALRDAAKSINSVVLAHRADRWADAIAVGQSTSESARTAGMPPLIVGMLASVNNAENLRQVMLFLARHYRSRFSHAAELIHSAYIPAVVLVLGAGVALVELSVFQFLIALIGSYTKFPQGF